MDLTILGSGGCMVIPKPLCRCRVCREARAKGVPFARTGPSAYIHDIGLLIDTPAESALQLNREGISKVDGLLFTHLDPDHVEGFRVVEQITLDFRTWEAYPDKRIKLFLPKVLHRRIRDIRSIYGPFLDFYEEQGFVEPVVFEDALEVGDIHIDALPVDRGRQTSFVYVFTQAERRIVYAPCDLKPFPEHSNAVRNADLLVIQPGLFENRLKHGFEYPEDHISRKTLYTFEETLALARRIKAARVVFVHLEEYWNRSYDDYLKIEEGLDQMQFAWDGMRIRVPPNRPPAQSQALS
ncbi:MAG: MBL fold metallo-hydrolase [Desulfobacteraceae bacterium]